MQCYSQLWSWQTVLKAHARAELPARLGSRGPGGRLSGERCWEGTT